jgi:hypothetical protein
MKRLSLFLFLIISLIMQGCVPQSAGGRRIASDNTSSPNLGQDPGGGNGSINQDDPLDGSDTTTVTTRVEIFHIVDPFDESFKSKVTIPKNFSGTLYMSGISINSLKNKWVYVKFKFGKDYETVTVPAVVGQAIEGITPRTNVEVLILHMDDRPFDNLRLPYDLYDYNDYTSKDPVTDPRDTGLYCRGLNLVDDASFSGGTSCSSTGQTCKYAYAKIVDRGLLTNEDPNNLGYALGSGAVRLITPTTQQIALGTSGLFSNESFSDSLMKCLPDTNKTSGINAIFNTALDEGTDMTIGRVIATSGPLYYHYNGPYQSINLSNWQLSGSAVFGDNGIFKKSFSSPNDVNYGYESLLFPRVGQKSLNASVEYLGSENPFDLKTKLSLSSSGDSKWMDGCNIRVSNYDSTSNEGIQSCNVTARIEVLVKDPDTGAEETRVSAKGVKLQLIRESLTDNLGREFLYSAMKTCSTNNACGSDECCYNSRCWSKDLVSACLDDSTGHGDLGIGQACSSDYQCQSLCCNTSTGTCAVHNPTLDEPVYCAKQPGQTCVAKEWCQKQNVTRCFIVRTGTTSAGADTCTMRCYNVPTFPSCIDGKCVPKASEPPPAFDPANPNCEEAKTPDEVNAILMGI